MEYKDLSFNISDSGTAEKVNGTNTIIMAIRNIMLSRPGNYPLTPGLGMDVEAKYQFEILDEYTLSDFKTNLLRQINDYIPAIDNVSVTVDKVTDIIDGRTVNAIGVSICAMESGQELNTYFLIVKNKETLSVFNETREN